MGRSAGLITQPRADQEAEPRGGCSFSQGPGFGGRCPGSGSRPERGILVPVKFILELVLPDPASAKGRLLAPGPRDALTGCSAHVELGGPGDCPSKDLHSFSFCCSERKEAVSPFLSCVCAVSRELAVMCLEPFSRVACHMSVCDVCWPVHRPQHGFHGMFHQTPNAGPLTQGSSGILADLLPVSSGVSGERAGFEGSLSVRPQPASHCLCVPVCEGQKLQVTEPQGVLYS